MSAAVLQAIEARRLAAGASRELLARLAGISERHYRRALDGLSRPRPGTLARLKGAAARLERRDGAASKADRHIRHCYRAALALVCAEADVDAAKVAAHDPGRRATNNPEWAEAAVMRRRAIVIVNQGLNIAQADIARALDLTPAAICRAMRAVEDARDADPALDAVLDRLAEQMSGGEW